MPRKAEKPRVIYHFSVEGVFSEVPASDYALCKGFQEYKVANSDQETARRECIEVANANGFRPRKVFLVGTESYP